MWENRGSEFPVTLHSSSKENSRERLGCRTGIRTQKSGLICQFSVSELFIRTHRGEGRFSDLKVFHPSPKTAQPIPLFSCFPPIIPAANETSLEAQMPGSLPGLGIFFHWMRGGENGSLFFFFSIGRRKVSTFSTNSELRQKTKNREVTYA